MSSPHRRARREKRRNKPYRRREPRGHMLVASDLVLRPLETIVDQLDISGSLDTDGKGNPIFRDGNGRTHDAAAAIEGLMWHFEMHSIRHGCPLPLDGVRELHVALKYIAPVMESTLVKLKSDLPVLRRAMALADPDDQLDLLRQTQIKAEMEAQPCPTTR